MNSPTGARWGRLAGFWVGVGCLLTSLFEPGGGEGTSSIESSVPGGFMNRGFLDRSKASARTRRLRLSVLERPRLNLGPLADPVGSGRRLVARIVVITVLVVSVCGIPALAGAAGQTTVRPNRLFPGNAPPGAVPLGAVPSSQELQLGVVLPPSNTGQLQSLLQDLYDPHSPEYHQWLRPGEFLQRFGPSAADVSSVESWLDGAGLSATQSGFALNVSAPASRIDSVLGTSLERYRTPSGRTGYLAQQTPLVPSTLANGTITSILGLNTVAAIRTAEHLDPANLEWEPSCSTTASGWVDAVRRRRIGGRARLLHP